MRGNIFNNLQILKYCFIKFEIYLLKNFLSYNYSYICYISYITLKKYYSIFINMDSYFCTICNKKYASYQSI